MTIPLELIEADAWPVLRQKIADQIDDRMSGLLHVATLEGMRHQQGYIEALQWVLEEARPKPRRRDPEDDD